MLATVAGGFAALAGCTGGDSPTPTGTPTRTGTPSETPTTEQAPPPDGVSSLDEGIHEWGGLLNDHAREATIDWTRFEDEDIELTFGMSLHPYSVTLSREASDGTQVKDYFEELTGITVNYEVNSPEQYWLETEEALSDGDGVYDGIMCTLWPAAQYHYGTDGDSWVRDLQQYVDDASLTDRDWLAMDDFGDRTLELLTFPDADGTESFVGFPNTVEVFGCVAVHEPTFETLGLSDPTNFDELEEAARQISESDEVDRESIVSTTSWTTLSALSDVPGVTRPTRPNIRTFRPTHHSVWTSCPRPPT